MKQVRMKHQHRASRHRHREIDRCRIAEQRKPALDAVVTRLDWEVAGGVAPRLGIRLAMLWPTVNVVCCRSKLGRKQCCSNLAGNNGCFRPILKKLSFLRRSSQALDLTSDSAKPLHSIRFVCHSERLRGGMQASSRRIAVCGKVSRSTAQYCERGTTHVGLAPNQRTQLSFWLVGRMDRTAAWVGGRQGGGRGAQGAVVSASRGQERTPCRG